MSHPASRIVPVVGFLAMVAVGVLGPEARPVAQAAPRPNEVFVANTAAQAVPVTVEGTPSVTVANAVTVANTVGVSGTVTVGNTAEEAVPVRDASAARIPWVAGGQIIIDPGETFESEQFTAAPPGFHIVVEAVNISGALPTDQVVSEATLLATAPGTSATFRFHLSPRPKTHVNFDRFGTHELGEVNVRSGAGVIVAVARGEADTGTGVFNVALSGRLVPVN